jgi:hypothetical protein
LNTDFNQNENHKEGRLTLNLEKEIIGFSRVFQSTFNKHFNKLLNRQFNKHFNQKENDKEGRLTLNLEKQIIGSLLDVSINF